MAEHILKTVNPFFQDVWDGLKDFEVRKNDRGFKVGDTVILVEFQPPGAAVGRFVTKRIKYVLEGGAFGIEKGFVVLGFER